MFQHSAPAIIFTLLTVATPEASAQIGFQPALDSETPNLIWLTAGVDESLLTGSLGYGRLFSIERIERTLVLATDMSIPLMHPDFRDFRWKIGVRMNAVQVRGFELPIELNLMLTGTDNALFRAVGIGTEIGALPGYYSSRWYLAGEIFWDQQLTTHIRHSEAYREYVYQDARDGWYGTASFFMRFGARVGGLPWRHLEIMLRGGYELHGRYDARVPPFYVILNFCFRV